MQDGLPQVTLHTDYDAVPAELRAVPQWVCWKYAPTLDGRQTKVPYSAADAFAGYKASSTDPATWAPFERAVKYQRRYRGIAGIGFVVTADDPFIGVDFDHVIKPDCISTPTDPGIDPWAASVIWRLASYSEVSPSGTGVRVFCRGKLPPGGRKSNKFPIEMYETGRFLTVTGRMLVGGPTTVEDRTDVLAEIHREVFGAPETERRPPRPPTQVTLEDRDLLDRAMNAANGAAFRALWNGDVTAHGGDDSAADLALCDHLAFWTGGSPERMDALFRQSGLMRAKWDERHAGDGSTYGQLTTGKAIRGATAFYSAQPVGAPPDCGPRFMRDVYDIETFLRGY